MAGVTFDIPVLPSDSGERKNIPLVTGVLDYFPNALIEVAKVSFTGNQKHNPGQPLHWSRGKSNDHADSIGRHLLERGSLDPVNNLRNSAQLAWRALALLQVELEEAGLAPLSRGSRAVVEPSFVPFQVVEPSFVPFQEGIGGAGGGSNAGIIIGTGGLKLGVR